MEVTGKLMTLAQAAELSACSPRTLRRAINDGQLIAMRLGQSGKSDRIHAADLEAWWQRSRLRPVADPQPSLPRDMQPPPLDTAEERIARRLGISTSGKVLRHR